MSSSKPPIASASNQIPSSLLSLLTGWMQQGIESFSAAQRVFEEVAVQQNAATTQTLQKCIPGAEHSPAAILTELAVRGTSSFIEAQKILLHLAQQESEVAMNGIKKRVDVVPGGEAVSDFVRRTLDTFLRMQQDFLKTTNKQITNWLESVQSRRGHVGQPLIDLARVAMEEFVHAQKKFLDLIAEETARASSRKHQPKTRAKNRDLPTLAEDATRAFVAAQQRLLEVVSQQMDMNLKTATRAMGLISPSCLAPIPNLTGESIRAFMGAEKTLIDALTNPGRSSKLKKTKGRRLVRSRPEGVHAVQAGG